MKMKFKSKIGDSAFIGLVIYAILTLAMFVFWVMTGIWWPAIVLTAILVFGILPIYFGTSYVIDRDSLKIYCGILGKDIPYNTIISATDAEGVAPSFALSSKRICIRYLDGEDIKTTFISPANRSQFRDLLNSAISNSVVNVQVPQTKEEKEALQAVEQAKEKLAEARTLSRAEERAIETQKEEEIARAEAERAKELKKLDDIIAGNVKAEEVVLSRNQEVMLAKRKKAEYKLLAKIRKAKEKQTIKEENAEYKERRRKEKEEKKNKGAVVETIPAKKENETAEEKQDRLAKEKASLKKAIDNAKADQYVPQKVKQNITTEPVPQSENTTNEQVKVTPQTIKPTAEQSATQNKTTEKASVVTEPAKQTKKAEEKLAEGTEKATKSPKTKSTTKKATLKKTATSKVSAKKTPKTAKMTAKTTKK